jgi:hypothetical protein
MLLSLESTLRVVFTVYGVFWVAVLLALFLGVGVLLKRRERLQAEGQHPEDHGAHH